MTSAISIGECMVELRPVEDGHLRRSFAGDAYNTDFASVIAATEATESLAERQARIASESLATLKEQVSALTTLNDSVLSIGAAISQAVLATMNSAGKGEVTPTNISSMYQDILGRPADQGGLDYWSSQAKTTSGSDLLKNFVNSAQAPGNADGAAAAAWGEKMGVGGTATVSKMYQDILKRPADQSGLSYWASLSSQMSSSSLQTAFLNAAKQQGGSDAANAVEWARQRGIPGFAKGGIANGTFLAGEYGPEIIQSPVPVRVLPNAQSRGYGDDGALIAEIKSLREEVKQLRSDQQGQHRESVSANYDANDRAAQTVVSGQQETAWREQNKPRYAA